MIWTAIATRAARCFVRRLSADGLRAFWCLDFTGHTPSGSEGLCFGRPGIIRTTDVFIVSQGATVRPGSVICSRLGLVTSLLLSALMGISSSRCQPSSTSDTGCSAERVTNP
jgi:hypothetical protein